jgi:hypothetical protein
MFRPERLLSTSIIYLKKDIEAILEALNDFGNFHTEQASEKTLVEYDQTIQKIEESVQDIDALIGQLTVPQVGLNNIFKGTKLP